MRNEGDSVRRVRRWPVVAAGALALAATAASCGGGGRPVTIGTSLPLSGEFAAAGEAARKGYEAWQSLVNEGGGLLGRRVQLVVRDNRSAPAAVAADYEALIGEDDVDLLLGTFSSLLNLPASAVAERAGMLYVEPAGGAPELFARGFERLFFAQQATAEHQADLFADWATGLPERARPKTAAYVVANDRFGGPVAEGIRTKLEAAGIRTVYSRLYTPATVDFRAIAAELKARAPDLVAQGSAGLADGVELDRALIEVGYTPGQLFQASAPSFADTFAGAIGVENTEAIFYAVSWHPDAQRRGNQEFLDAHHELHGDEMPAEDAADAFAAGQVLQAAVEAVGELDQERLAEWLHANAVDTILGTLSWDETGAPEQAFLLAQWQGGDVEIVLPRESATSETIVDPKPAWTR